MMISWWSFERESMVQEFWLGMTQGPRALEPSCANQKRKIQAWGSSDLSDVTVDLHILNPIRILFWGSINKHQQSASSVNDKEKIYVYGHKC